MLARSTHGVPRLLGQAAHKALALAASAEVDIVDAEAAMEALAVLGLETEVPAEAMGEEESEEGFPRIGAEARASGQG